MECDYISSFRNTQSGICLFMLRSHPPAIFVDFEHIYVSHSSLVRYFIKLSVSKSSRRLVEQPHSLKARYRRKPPRLRREQETLKRFSG